MVSLPPPSSFPFHVITDNIHGFPSILGHGFAWGLNNEAELGLGVEEGSVVEKPKEIEVKSVQGGCRIVSISGNAQHTVLLACRIDDGDGGRIRNAA